MPHFSSLSSALLSTQLYKLFTHNQCRRTKGQCSLIYGASSSRQQVQIRTNCPSQPRIHTSQDFKCHIVFSMIFLVWQQILRGASNDTLLSKTWCFLVFLDSSLSAFSQNGIGFQKKRFKKICKIIQISNFFWLIKAKVLAASYPAALTCVSGSL